MMKLNSLDVMNPQADRQAGSPVLGWTSRHSSVILAFIILAAVVARVVSAFAMGDIVVVLPGIYDQISYDSLARQVLAGKGFSFPTDWWPATRAGEPTAHWSYLYTLYLSAVYAVSDLHPLAARLIQAVLAGILHPWLAWRIGRRLFGLRVGLVAAGLTASYTYFIYYAGALMTETFYIVAILWAIDLATGVIADRNSLSLLAPRFNLRAMAPWLCLGLALAIAVLLRQLFLLIVPFVFAYILFSRRIGAACRRNSPGYFRSTVLGLLTTTLVIVALLLPFTIRNYQSFGRFVLLNTNSGYAFFWANHPIHGTDFVSVLSTQTYRDLIPTELRSLDEAALDEALMSRGVRFVLDDPVRYIGLSFNRIKDYFALLPSPESSPISALVRALSFGILLPFMLLGVLIPAIRYRRQEADTWMSRSILLYGFVVIYTLIHLLSWTLVRYRLPVDAVLVVFAALAVVRVTAWLRDPRSSSNGRKE